MKLGIKLFISKLFDSACIYKTATAIFDHNFSTTKLFKKKFHLCLHLSSDAHA